MIDRASVQAVVSRGLRVLWIVVREATRFVVTGSLAFLVPLLVYFNWVEAGLYVEVARTGLPYEYVADDVGLVFGTGLVAMGWMFLGFPLLWWLLYWRPFAIAATYRKRTARPAYRQQKARRHSGSAITPMP